MSGAPTDFLYYNVRSLFATAQLNWPVAAVKAMLVSNLYSPQLTHVNVSDIPPSAIIIRDLVCTGIGQKNGVCFCSIPQMTGLTSPYEVIAVILYVAGSDDAHSPLVYYSSTGPGFPFVVDGFSYFVGFDQSAGGFFQV